MQSARDRWFERLHAERERRLAAAPMIDGQDPREWFLAELAQMAERVRAAPGWREPSEAEMAESAAFLATWFRDHGYGR